MEEEKLLKVALNLHYRNNPKIITDAMKVIQNYSTKEQTNSEYDKILRILHDLMNDLPPNILLYFLTTVPLPKQEDGKMSTFSDLIEKSRASLLDNMQSVLTEYINTMSCMISINDGHTKTESEVGVAYAERNDETVKAEPKVNLVLKRETPNSDFKSTSIQAECSSKKIKRSRGTYGTYTKCCKKLLEICAEYVVQNLEELQKFYNQKNTEVWSLVNKNVYSAKEQVQCYRYIEDVNRKLKWLRMIEAGHISVDVIRELYGDSEIFLKEQHLYNLLDDSIFSVSEELKETIRDFVNN